MEADLTWPVMNPREKRELEHEAGYPFLRDEQAYRYMRRRIADESLDEMLRGHREENRRRVRRDA